MPVEKWAFFARKVLIKREKVQFVTENVSWPISRKAAKFDAKTQRKTLRLLLTLRLCVKLFSVLIEENLEVAAHVGFVEGVFGGG